MADLSAYAITLGSSSYPAKYAGLLAYLTTQFTALEAFTIGGGNVGVGMSPLGTHRLSVNSGGSTANTAWNGLAVSSVAAWSGVSGNNGVYLYGSNAGGSLNAFFRIKAGAGGVYDGAEIATDNRPFRFLTSTTEDTSERMRVATAGDILFGTTSVPTSATGGAAFVVDTFSRRVLYLATTTTSTANLALFINGNNAVGSISVSASTTAFNTTSDQRLKTNVTDAGDSGQIVDAIRVRAFDWRADASHQRFGFIAQELVQHVPEAVKVGNEGAAEKPEDVWAVDYSKLVPLLVKEIQSLRTRLAALEAQP